MIRTTLIGGVIFLIPLVFLSIVLGRALQMSATVVAPLETLVPVERVAGVAALTILSVLGLLAICFLAGLAARLRFFSRRMDRLDALLVDLMPGYAAAKSTVGGIAEVDSAMQTLQPVIVTFDDHRMVAFEIERLAEGVIVFLPGAPSPWSGNSVLVEPARVTPLNMPTHQVTKLLRVLGRGTGAALAARQAASPDLGQTVAPIPAPIPASAPAPAGDR